MDAKLAGSIKKILLVDDEECVIFTFTKLLENRGFEVVAALSGEEALPLIDSSLHAVVTDMHMHALNGNDVAMATRNFDCKIKTILVYSPKTITPKKELFDHIIIKPLDLNLLFAAID